jgi:hypothetical protein
VTCELLTRGLEALLLPPDEGLAQMEQCSALPLLHPPTSTVLVQGVRPAAPKFCTLGTWSHARPTECGQPIVQRPLGERPYCRGHWELARGRDVGVELASISAHADECACRGRAVARGWLGVPTAGQMLRLERLVFVGCCLTPEREGKWGSCMWGPWRVGTASTAIVTVPCLCDLLDVRMVACGGIHTADL